MTVTKHHWLAALVLLATLVGSLAQARELVLVFENSLASSSALDAMARSQMLMRNLAVAEVPQAMFLVRPRALNSKNQARLALYSERGHLLVNAGYDQSLVSKGDLYAYEVAILKANRLLQPYRGYRQLVHFSYLHERGERSIQQRLSAFLAERGYRPAFTYFSPGRGLDAYIDQLYQARIKRNRPVDMAALEQVYIDLIVADLQAQDLDAYSGLGYSPRQTLVLQENDLAAYFLVPLIDRLRAQGWRPVSAAQLVDDPIANPLFQAGWGANSAWHSITGLADPGVAYPRVLGERQQQVNEAIQRWLPGFIEN